MTQELRGLGRGIRSCCTENSGQEVSGEMNTLGICGSRIRVVIAPDLTLAVLSREGRTLWRSSTSHKPVAQVRPAGQPLRAVPLAEAAQVSARPFEEGPYRGHTVRLSGLNGADAVLEASFGVNPKTDELLVQVAQVDGPDSVVAVEHFYRFEKLVSEGGYVVAPRGSGYIIPADCPDALPGEDDMEPSWVGANWAMPMFGMVSAKSALCAIVDTWWDFQVQVHHQPGVKSFLDFSWAESLGKLAYPRRLIIRIAEDMGYVAMAKVYREYARKHGVVRTLEEKAHQTPAIHQAIRNVLYRWPAWNSKDGPAALEDIRRMREMGLGVTFFFPKWSALGYDPKTGELRPHPDGAVGEAGWQAYLLDDPVPGGWRTLVHLAEEARKMGALVQGMFVMRWHFRDAPGYNEDRFAREEDGNVVDGASLSHNAGAHDDEARLKPALDNAAAHGLRFDALYFDGYAAFRPLPQDFSPEHVVTRRQKYEMQNAVFAEVRRRGMIPGGELRRFWAIPDCDWFFYTDWSNERQGNVASAQTRAPAGEPVPLCQLAFGDCCMSGFSGNACGPQYNWFPGRTPRLYELMYASQPCYNWLVPQTGFAPVPDWNDETAKRRFEWLKRWSAFYRTVAMSEMVSHQFLSPDRKHQRVEFANGVAAEFDMAGNRFRITGAKGFTGDWETPEEL